MTKTQIKLHDNHNHNRIQQSIKIFSETECLAPPLKRWKKLKYFSTIQQLVFSPL